MFYPRGQTRTAQETPASTLRRPPVLQKMRSKREVHLGLRRGPGQSSQDLKAGGIKGRRAGAEKEAFQTEGACGQAHPRHSRGSHISSATACISRCPEHLATNLIYSSPQPFEIGVAIIPILQSSASSGKSQSHREVELGFEPRHGEENMGRWGGGGDSGEPGDSKDECLGTPKRLVKTSKVWLPFPCSLILNTPNWASADEIPVRVAPPTHTGACKLTVLGPQLYTSFA